MINPWIQFIISAALIVWAGSRLTRSAAVIAENTGIGTAWAGALLLPLATSLPELVTTLRAVMIDIPDLAVGNIFGSCLFNLSLLAVIDLVQGRGPLTSRVSTGHTLTASLSIITLSLALLAMQGLLIFPVGFIGLESIGIAAVYIFGSRFLFNYEKGKIKKPGPDLPVVHRGKVGSSTRSAIAQFTLAAALIVVAGVFVTDASDLIALETGLGHSFVGTIFLAISTSLPETVTTITAVRLGYLDMAVANVFGANLMNLFIIFLADLLYLGGPILAVVSAGHIFSALTVVLLSAIVIFGINYRSSFSVGGIGLDALLVLSGYLMAVYVLFSASG